MPRSWVYFLAPAAVGAALMTTSLVEAWLMHKHKAPITMEVRDLAFLQPAWAVAAVGSAIFGAGILLGHFIRGDEFGPA